MTLATGERARADGRIWRQAAGHQAAGFTLVEIIVVMAIIVTLFGLVAVGVGGLRGKAAERATKALLIRIQAYLDDYKSETGSYPPDGIDTPVTNDKGTPIKGSACLYYFLMQRPLTKVEIRAGKKFVQELPPIAKFQESELTPLDPNFPDAREIVDGWRTPIHYDNTEDGQFRPQRGDMHIPPLDDDVHPVDPRSGDYAVGNDKAVETVGVQGMGFDIWSYAEQGHEVKEIKYLPIATWSLKED